MSRIRTTNFDAVLASDPQDVTAATVVSQAGIEDESREAALVAARRAYTVNTEAIRTANAAGLPKADLVERGLLLQAEIQRLAGGTSKERRALNRAASEARRPTYEGAFIKEAKRLLPRLKYLEIVRAAEAIANEVPSMEFERVA